MSNMHLSKALRLINRFYLCPKSRSLSYRNIYRGRVLCTTVTEVGESVVKLLLCNSQGCTAESEDAPEEIVHSHIRPDVIERAVSHKHNGEDGGVRGYLADLRILDVGLIDASVTYSDKVNDNKYKQGDYTRLASKLEKEVSAVVVVEG